MDELLLQAMEMVHIFPERSDRELGRRIHEMFGGATENPAVKPKEFEELIRTLRHFAEGHLANRCAA